MLERTTPGTTEPAALAHPLTVPAVIDVLLRTVSETEERTLTLYAIANDGADVHVIGDASADTATHKGKPCFPPGLLQGRTMEHGAEIQFLPETRLTRRKL